MPAGVPAAAFELDTAYCWFRHGDRYKMVESLTAAAAALKGNYDRYAEFFEFAAQKNLGNTVLWLQGYFAGDSQRGTKPFVGSSSNPDIDQAAYQTLPVGPPAIAAFSILDLADTVAVETSGLKELILDLEASNNAIAGLRFQMWKLSRSLKSGNLKALAGCAYGVQVAIWRSTEALKLESSIDAEFSEKVDVADLPFNSSDNTWLLLMGLTLRTIIKGSPNSLADEWKADLAGRPRAEDFKTIIDGLVPHFAISAATAHFVMRAMPPTYANIAAAAKFLASHQRSPRDTLYAQASLLNWLQASPVKTVFHYSLKPFFAAFSDQWRQHISTPALLVNPRMTIPMLESAMNSKAFPAKCILSLLLAACPACRATIPPSLVAELEKLSRQRSTLETFLTQPG